MTPRELMTKHGFPVDRLILNYNHRNHPEKYTGMDAEVLAYRIRDEERTFRFVTEDHESYAWHNTGQTKYVSAVWHQTRRALSHRCNYGSDHYAKEGFVVIRPFGVRRGVSERPRRLLGIVRDTYDCVRRYTNYRTTPYQLVEETYARVDYKLHWLDSADRLLTVAADKVLFDSEDIHKGMPEDWCDCPENAIRSLLRANRTSSAYKVNTHRTGRLTVLEGMTGREGVEEDMSEQELSHSYTGGRRMWIKLDQELLALALRRAQKDILTVNLRGET